MPSPLLYSIFVLAAVAAIGVLLAAIADKDGPTPVHVAVYLVALFGLFGICRALDLIQIAVTPL